VYAPPHAKYDGQLSLALAPCLSFGMARSQHEKTSWAPRAKVFGSPPSSALESETTLPSFRVAVQ